jgi:antitoxin component YwqK of YwqJK toxin-antitoxin module
MQESNFRDGKPWTAVAWKTNGEKCPVTNLKDGNGVRVIYNEDGQKNWEYTLKDGKPDGLQTGWYENGQKMQELNCKDGKPMEAKSWKTNGEKCPVTNLKDGNGVSVRYNEDGTESSRYTYKDGEVVD